MALTFSDQDNDSVYGTDPSLALRINVDAGDLIVILIGSNQNQTISSISDDVGNTYTIQTVVTGSYTNFYIAYVLSCVSTMNNCDITVNMSGIGRASAIVANFIPDSGETVTLDQTATGSSEWSAGPAVTGEVNTTGTDELLIAGFQATITWSNQEIPSGTSATVLTSTETTITGFYRIVTSTISGCEAEADMSASGYYAGRLSCFKSEAAGGLSIPIAMHHYKQMQGA